MRNVLAVGLSGSIAIILAATALALNLAHGPLGKPGAAALLVLIGGLAYACATGFELTAYSRKDEVAQARIRFAWTYGGSIGLVVGYMAPFALLVLLALPAFHGARDAVLASMSGRAAADAMFAVLVNGALAEATSIVLSHAIGVGAAWVWWQARQ